MTTAQHSGATRRPGLFAVWFLLSSVGGTVLLLVLTVVLWRLPSWAPEWVGRYSPSLDYALWSMRQDESGVVGEWVLPRAWEWEGGVAAYVRQRVEHPDPAGDDWTDMYLLRALCSSEMVAENAEERLTSGRAEVVMQRFRERSRDDLLAACLTQLKHSDVRWRVDAAESLGDLQDPEAIPALIRLLDDSVWQVREQAAASLTMIGDRAVIPDLIACAVLHPHRNPRPYLNAVVEFGEPIPEHHLIAMLAVQSAWAHELVLLRLANHRTSASLPALVRLTMDLNTYTVAHARRLLKATLTRDELPMLIGYLRHDDPIMRDGSAAVLVDAGDLHAIPPLLDLLTPVAGYIDPHVEKVLLSILPIHSDEHLYEAGQHPDPGVRAWVARQLGRRHLAGADTKLLAMAQDPESTVRASALRALGVIRAPQLLSLGERALLASVIDERVAAIRALGDLGDPSAIAWLRRFLRSAEVRERIAGVQALGQLGKSGDFALIQEIRARLADPDPPVQEAARTALERLSGDVDEVRTLEQRRLQEFN